MGHAARALTLSEDAYRILLKLYPPAFREELGPHMLLTFRDCARDAYRRGRFPALMMLWLPTLLDLIKTAAEERAQKGSLNMNKEWLIRFGGTAMLIAGVMWALGSIGQLETSYYDDYGGFDGLYETMTRVWGFAFLPMVIGLYALTAYAGSNRLMQIGAWLAVIACAVTFVAMLAGFVLNIDTWAIWVVSLMLTFIGVLIFGSAALSAKPLPRWNGMPLVVVAMLLLILAPNFLGISPEMVTNTFDRWPIVILWALMGVAWMALGFAMLPIRMRTPAVA